jgi:hypothetical protein
VKPNFVSGGAVPLSIYGKVGDLSATLPGVVLSVIVVMLTVLSQSLSNVMCSSSNQITVSHFQVHRTYKSCIPNPELWPCMETT